MSQAGHTDLEEEEQTKITVTEVRQQYKLKDEDIAHLDCEVRRNPHYRNAAPMRLYDLEDIKAAAASKKLRLASEEETAKEVRAARDQANDEAKKAHALSCKARVQSWAGASSAFQYRMGTILPLDVLEKILKFLCNDFEPNGVRACSVISRDLVNASMACKELHVASRAAFRHLKNVQLGQSGVRSTPQEGGLLDQFLSDPNSLRLDQIRSIAKSCGVKVSQPKPVLIMDVLNVMNLKAPSQIPASVLMAVNLEKTRCDSAFCSQCMKIEAFRTAKSEFSLRIACTEVGLTTLAHLKAVTEVIDAAAKAARDKADQERRAAIDKVYEERRAARDKADQERRAKKIGTRICVSESCTKTSAVACTMQMCGECCRGPCGRHRR